MGPDTESEPPIVALDPATTVEGEVSDLADRGPWMTVELTTDTDEPILAKLKIDKELPRAKLSETVSLPPRDPKPATLNVDWIFVEA